MKYTKEQSEKILNYIVKKAKTEYFSEQIKTASINGEVKSIFELTYGPADDNAKVKFVTNFSLTNKEFCDLVTNYKKLKAYVVLNKWDISWEAETPDEVLDCLAAVVKGEYGVSMQEYLQTIEDTKRVEKQLSLQEQFFKEN